MRLFLIDQQRMGFILTLRALPSQVLSRCAFVVHSSPARPSSCVPPMRAAQRSPVGQSVSSQGSPLALYCRSGFAFRGNTLSRYVLPPALERLWLHSSYLLVTVLSHGILMSFDLLML